MFGPLKRYQVLLILFCISVLYYSLLRFQFFVWNQSLFTSLTWSDLAPAFLLGVRFDLAAQAFLFAPLVLLSLVPWPRSLNRLWMNAVVILFVLLQIPFAILNQGDTEFINFVGRRFTFDTLFLMNEMKGKLGGFFTTYGLLIFINFLSLCAFLAAAFWSIRVSWKKTQWSWSVSQALKWAGATFIAIAVIVICSRGGLQKKPLNIVEANRLAQAHLNNLALNSTFTFLKSFNKPSLERKTYFSEEEMTAYFPQFVREGTTPVPPQGSNIVLIVVESFGKEYITSEFTPFLVSLCQKAMCSESAYANGRRSVEGIAAALAAVPALMNEPFISSAFSANKILHLGQILEEVRYETSFFHGGRNGTMHFDAFTEGIGIGKYYGATEYPHKADDDGVWGIWDEPFLQWVVGQLNQASSPFFSTVFTLSSHHPFRVPPQYKERFKEGPNPLTKTLQYTDYSLEKFFASASQQEWFKDTVFIITADHTALHLGPETTNDVGDYKIPFIVYSPKINLALQERSTLIQQMDIPFTVMELAGVQNVPVHPLGSSIFTDGDKVVVNFIDGKYILFARDYQVIWRGEELWSYYLISDEQQQNPLSLESLSEEQQIRLEYLRNRMKASIQYFTEGMLENKLFREAE